MSPLGILVVDDFESLRRSLRSILESRSDLLVVGEASDGLEAVQQSEALKPDLVLLDIGIPKLNGVEAATRIHQVAAEAKIVFVTQNSDPEFAQAALSNGAAGYVLKSDAGRELLPAIESVLRGEIFVSSGIESWDSKGQLSERY
jgi:DNA-binding NarL/FixJ family response regulator